MSVRHISVVLGITIGLTALVLGGCAGASSGTGTSPVGPPSAGAIASVAPSGTAQSTATVPPTVSASPGGSSSKEVSGDDLAAIKKQLDAMQKEIDGLKMPSDNDFSGAEGAVY